MVDFVDEDLDLLGPDPVRVDERLGDGGHELALLFDLARGLLDGDDRQGLLGFFAGASIVVGGGPVHNSD
jgi:hypothetical protein